MYFFNKNVFEIIINIYDIKTNTARKRQINGKEKEEDDNFSDL